MAKKGSGSSATGAAAPPVQRRIEADTICFSEEAAPAGAGHRFAVRVTCIANRSLVYRRRGRRPKVLRQKHPATTTTFTVADLAALRSDDACRGALRGMLAQLPLLRSLRLAEDEWDAVVPADVVPEIVDAATNRGGNGFTFCLTMSVRRRVIHDDRVLLLACKEKPVATAKGEHDECAICFDGLVVEGESAVELPVCDHAFHRRCISKWFSKATTCPMCRADVRISAVPEFVDMSAGDAALGLRAEQ